MTVVNQKVPELYLKRILKEFKNKFSEHLDCGAIKSFDYIKKEVLFELGLEYLIQTQLVEVDFWYKNITGFYFLDSLLNNDELQELIIHTSNKAQIITAAKSEAEIDIDELDYDLSLKVLAVKHNITWNYSVPFASFDAKLYDLNFRVTLIHKSITSSKFSKVFFRRISKKIFPLTGYTEVHAEILKEMVSKKKNIIVAGSTGSGKTSFLSSLISTISSIEHTLILEDTNEIIKSSIFTTKLTAYQNDNKSLMDYMTYSMRMSPDRIILGEIRSKEIVPFILAMNTGHNGLMASIHANSAKDTLERMCLLFSMFSENKDINYVTILELITKNIDYVIFLEDKKITEIIELLGNDGKYPIYRDIMI